MRITLILVFGGLALGCGTAAAIGLYLVLTRPYRKVRNRFAIHFGQAFVAGSALTSLFLLQKLEQSFSVAGHSSDHYYGLYSYVLGLSCGILLALIVEFRWRRLSGLVTAVRNDRPVVPGAYRRLLVALGMMTLSIGFSVAFWASRPKPISAIFGGISLLFVFAAMIFLGRGIGRKQMRELRAVTFVLSAALFCMFGALAWKFRETDPPLSLAWLISLAVPCFVALSALVFLRQNADTGA